jgi:hypothetical protein
MSSADKWQANARKVAYARAFPGRLASSTEAIGKTVRDIVSAEGVSAIIFSDGTFYVFAPSEIMPGPLLKVIASARPLLETSHLEGYAELDRLSAYDREMAREARLQNILGAVRNNLPEIPELKEALRNFLNTLD